MRKINITYILSVIVLTLIVSLTIQCLGESFPEKQAETIQVLVANLGSNNHKTREAAYNELVKYGETLIGEYLRIKCESHDTSAKQLQSLKQEISRFAKQLYFKGCQNKDVEIEHRTKQIYQRLYDLTSTKIVFNSEQAVDEIYVMDADGKNKRNLTKSGVQSLFPVCSPDGKKIAFQSLCKDNRYAIFVMDADGKNQKRLTYYQSDIGNPVWSPDSTKIAFRVRHLESWEIYVMDADGKNQKKLTSNSQADGYSWSPDGTKIAFRSFNKVYIMDSTGKNQNNMVKNEVIGISDDIAWSPNGKKIAFSSMIDTPGYGAEIYTMDIDGKNKKRLTENKMEDNYPLWSPDGTKIAFTSELDGKDEIYVIDADGKNQKRLTNSKGHDWFHAWSPDGTKIVFVSERDGNDEIYVMDADGKNQKRLTDNKNDDSYPVWYPILSEEIAILFKLDKD